MKFRSVVSYEAEFDRWYWDLYKVEVDTRDPKGYMVSRITGDVAISKRLAEEAAYGWAEAEAEDLDAVQGSPYIKEFDI